MKSYQILLGSPEGIKRFANAAVLTQCEVRVESETMIVDGKSVLALFSLPMNSRVTLWVSGNDEECEHFRHALEPFFANEES